MNWFQKNFRKIVYVSFLIPIILVAMVSISHVTKWYGISNPFSWAIYLSVAVEVAALSALAAISAKMGRKVYLPFGIVTLIQFIGNIFFAYQYIDIHSVTFKDWVDLVDPLVSYLGVESGNMIAHKRFLALFAGGMLPLISLSFLHMLVKFEEEDKKEETIKEPKKKKEIVEETTQKEIEFSIKEEEKQEESQEFSTNEPDWENIFQNNEYDVEEQPPIVQNFEHTIEMEPLPFWNDLIDEPIVEETPQVEEETNDDVLIEEVQDSKDDNDRVSLEDLDEVEETPVETTYPIIPPVINPLPQTQTTQPKRLTYIKRV
jgi:hypothetical protein